MYGITAKAKALMTAVAPPSGGRAPPQVAAAMAAMSATAAKRAPPLSALQMVVEVMCAKPDKQVSHSFDQRDFSRI
jgi:hypothetical protein